MKQTQVKEIIVSARVYAEATKFASALVFVVDSAGDVAPYFVEPLEVIGGEKSVEHAILDRIRDAGLFGDRDERDIRVHYWKTSVERKRATSSLPASLRILRIIH
ncbi:MAG: hypothetical protein IKU86_07875 [Thermoguttaceae bacterium]|nr:hypothetical protein [Thermoguttaceae bacterium]